MTKKERKEPDLLIRDKTALSRIKRLAKGSGTSLDGARQFVSDFQQMRAMMARMSNAQDPGAQLAGGVDAAAGPQPNRNARRADKSKKKPAKKKLKGFG